MKARGGARTRPGAKARAGAKAHKQRDQPSSGTVVSVHGAWLRIGDANGAVHRVRGRRSLGPVVCGDQVEWSTGRGGGIVEAIALRDNVLTRPDDAGRPRPIAANLDRVLVVIAPLPPTPPSFLDRYLTNLELQGHAAAIVLNKVDLLAAQPDKRAHFEAIEAVYGGLGYAVVRTSTKTDQGLADLRALLSGTRSIMVGVSGAGKSSLANALIPDLDIPVGALSADDSHGRHTTSTARVLPLAGGGSLVDSPGVRDFATWHIASGELSAGFRELTSLAHDCRFRNCLHSEEPGCAVKAAALDGRLDAGRWRSYQAMLLESLEAERERYT